MNLSFSTLNRFVEEKIGADPAYCAVIEKNGRPYLSLARSMTPPSSSVWLFRFAFGAVSDHRGTAPAFLEAAFRFGPPLGPSAAGARRNRVSDRMTSSSIDGAPSFKSPDIRRSSSRIGSLSGAPRARRSSSRMVLSFFGPIKGVPPKAS